MSATTLKRLLSETVQLAQKPALNFFELATKLAKLHESDPSTLRDIPQQTGMSRRRLYYLLEVGRLLSDQQISKPEAEAVGWTKLQIIARHLSRSEGAEGELRQFMKQAIDLPSRSLAQALRGEAVPDDCAVQFTLDKISKGELDEALLAYGAERSGRGLIGREEALLRIVRVALANSP